MTLHSHYHDFTYLWNRIYEPLKWDDFAEWSLIKISFQFHKGRVNRRPTRHTRLFFPRRQLFRVIQHLFSYFVPFWIRFFSFFRILFYQSLHFHVLLNFHLFIHFPLFHLTAPSYMTRDSYTGYNILRYCSTSSWDHIKSMYNLFRDLVVPIQGQIKAYWGPKLWEVVQTLYGSS